jgi:HEAT repeat protein
MMKRTVLAILSLLVLAAPAAAGDNRKSVEAKLFDAYYKEQVKRDLPKARELYEWVFKAGDAWPDLRIRAKLGLARVAARTGGDAAAEQEAAKILVRKHEKEITVKVKVVLERDFEETRRLIAEYQKSDGADAQITDCINRLVQGPNTSSGQAAVKDLLLFGDRCVPQVAEALRADRPHIVSAAAQVLVRLDTDLAAEALLAAFTDEKTRYRTLLVRQLEGGTSKQAELFRKALVDSSREVRVAAAHALSYAMTNHDQRLREVAVGSLGNPDAEVRRILVGSHRNWTAADLLRAAHRLMDDVDPEVRKEVVDLLGPSMPAAHDVPPDVQKLAVDLFRIDDAEVRNRLVRFAIDAGGEVARKVVVLGLADESEEVRSTTIRFMSHVAWSPEFLPALVASIEKTVLSDREREWRSRFREAMRRLESAKKTVENGALLVDLAKTISEEAPEARRRLALPDVLAALRTHPVETKVESYRVLRRPEEQLLWFQIFESYTSRHLQPLVLEALGSKNDRVRAAAVEALVRIGDPELVAKRMAALMSDPAPGVRTVAIEATLPRLSGEELSREVLKALGDSNGTVKYHAIGAIARVPGISWEEPLLEAVRGDPERWGQLAVAAVAKRGEPELTRRILGRVLEAMRDCREKVRASAWAAAESALSDGAILDALENGPAPFKLWAADIAAKRHLLDAWPLLLELKGQGKAYEKALTEIRDYHLRLKEYLDLRDTKGEDLYAKADALGRSGDELQMIAACHAYAALGGPRAISRLLDLVRNPNANVRQAALEALKKL